MTDIQISDDASYLSLSDEIGTRRYHSIWLRDNATDASSRSQSNGQKLMTIQAIPDDVTISAVQLRGQQIDITFSPDSLTASFNINWLLDNTYDKPYDKQAGWTSSRLQTWDAGFQASLTSSSYPELLNDDVLLRDWLKQIANYGFGLLTGGPTHEEALFNIINRFGFVRETNYGKHFEVRTEVNPSNLAYTGMGLQAHTDNPYRDPVPTLQCLYCLESSASGGDNTIVDGFRVAERLRDEHPDYFKLLTNHCVRFAYSGGASVDLQSRRPIIELNPDGELVCIRFNNRSAAAISDVPFDKMPQFYRAMKTMAEICDDPAMEVRFRMEPGDSFIVDNTRVLHARKPYSGSGTRWLQGCYADKDGLLSTLAVLDAKHI